VVSAVVLAAWWLIAHNSGAGWVQALGDVVFGVLLIGTVGPAVLVARARLELTGGVPDGTAGQPIEVAVRANARVRVTPVHPGGPPDFVGPRRRRRGSDSTTDTLTLLPARRGVYGEVVVDVASASPFGLQWWTRQVVLPLPQDVHVSPRRGRSVELPARADEDAGDHDRRRVAPVGEARALRPYRPGDNRRYVHWPATAHTGTLMVRDMEGPAAEPITVTVRLPPDPDAAEPLAERALGTVLALLDRGDPVVLSTDEHGGPVRGPVDDRLMAGRRLARAVAPGGEDSSAPAVVSAEPWA
jgi:uncharacterized protein (DUF58 family)